MSFSERMELVPKRVIQVNNMDDRLRNRLYNFYNDILEYVYSKTFLSGERMIKYITDKLGIAYYDFSRSCSKIADIFLENEMWYVPYDIIEYALEFHYYELNKMGLINQYDYEIVELNNVLSEEKSGYRMVERQFVPITDENELDEIKDAIHSGFDAVDQHIKKALTLYSDRDNPDYENSIKESISAVESMCCIITGLSGANATLGAALKKLEDNGVKIHSAMNSAFSKLYGYTSDQDGIRHGGIDFVNAPEEDARDMLVSCSAFVNYLKDKYSKSQNGS